MTASSPTEPPPQEPVPAFPGQRAAVILGLALLAMLGLSLALVLRDNAHRTELEVVTESSAVGDTHYIKLPDPLPPEPYPVVAHLHDKALVPTTYKHHEKSEAEMKPLMRDEATGVMIYQGPVRPKEAGDPPSYYLKIAPGEFLKVRAESSEPPP